MKICYRGQQVFLKSAESQRKNKTAKRRSKFSQGTRYLPLTIKKLSNYLDNPELALFLSDKMCLEVLNDFLRTTSRLSENKSLWFSQVSHHFDEMKETQIALACTLAKIFENN